MRAFVVILSLGVLLVAAGEARAHCGKPHPDNKDKQTAARPAPKPE